MHKQYMISMSKKKGNKGVGGSSATGPTIMILSSPKQIHKNVSPTNQNQNVVPIN